MAKWLDKYNDGGPIQENYNDTSASMGPGFVGMGNNTKGRNYSPAWGGQFQWGGMLQPNDIRLPSAIAPPNREDILSSELARSIGGEDGEPAYLVPSFKGGRRVDEKKEFNKTGEHLGGPFKTWQEAEKFGEMRHEYVEKGQSLPSPLKWWGEMAMGGSIPGAVGFTYARTQDPAPSNGKYAKKTLASAQNGIVVNDSKDPRLKSYTDSLNLYKAYRMQDKLMGPGSKVVKTKLTPYEWSTKERKDRRVGKKIQGIDELVSEDFRSEKEQFEKGYNNWSARKEDKKLLDYYKSLGFGPNNIEYHSSPDLVNDKIRPTGTYFDGSFESPVYKKPIQKVTYQPTPAVAQQVVTTPIQQPTPQPKPLYEYEGEQVMAQTPYGGGAAMVGVKKKDGTVEYIKPEDYQRMGVPKYGQDYIKSKQKMQNGGEMQFYQQGLDWKPKSISKNGSVIKDDRGQWDHPGEITEIGSNDITMQGVDYPVLGVSDTGDTQMMQPGQDYKFDGEKVTEYPMMQEGGWLDKYPEPMRQDATRNVIPRKMTAAEKKESTSKATTARQKSADKAKEVVAERTKNRQTKGDLNTPGSWHTEDKGRLFPSSVGGAGEMFDEYVNPATYVGVLADALGESVAAKDPKAIAMSLALAAGTGAIGVDPLGSTIKGVKSTKAVGKYLTEETALKNAHKLNPYAFQPTEGMMYRGLGKEGMEDAMTSGVFRAKQNVQPAMMGNLDMAKRFNHAYFSPDYEVANMYGKGYIAEVPRGTAEWNTRYSKRNDWSQIAKTDIPISQGKILQKDWLKGYKEVPKKEEGGWLNKYK